jgi:hypothetical protein
MAKKKQKAKKHAASKPKAKKQTAKKQPAKKQPPKKQPPKKQPPKKHKRALTNYQPGICQDFPATNLGVVYFQNIPTDGCTLTQVNANSYFPFSPYSTNANGLRYTTLDPGDSTTIVVPDLNGTKYNYIVSCCPLQEATHTVTVT